jgi:GT2 family glycosyltransferase
MTSDSELGRVGVVIPAYNRREQLARTLEALGAQDYPGDKLTVVVADDGSEEDIDAVVERWDPPFESVYVRQDHDGFGAGKARNLGAAQLTEGVVIFLDSDAIVRPDFVRRHTAWHDANERAVVIGGRIQLDSTTDPSQQSSSEDNTGTGQSPNREDFRAVLSRRTSGFQASDEAYRSFVSSNVSLRLDLFLSTGGFDQRFRWWGSEDSEFGWRLWQAGADFVDDSANSIYHQTDADTAGGSAGREEARKLNRGLLTSLVPQRFYRRGMPVPPPEVPKFSVVVHDIADNTPLEMWRALLAQTLPDFEMVIIARGQDHDPFAGAAEGERRIQFVADPTDAVRASRGEYLIFTDGHAALGRTLLQNIRKRLDQRPAAVGLEFGVETPDGIYPRPEDIRALETAWELDLPLGIALRRRPLIRRMNDGEGLSGAISSLRASEAIQHTDLALIAMPGIQRTARPEAFVFRKTPRAQLKEAASLGFGTTMRVGARLARQRLRPEPASVTKTKPDRIIPDVPGIRYVGWVGKDNLGDEAMLEAARQLLDWGDIQVRGEAKDLLLLGGGTLINRNQYLRWLTERDSPRIERAVLGTGVASPDFWGLTEDTSEWLRWLATCAYVGVRGPRSAALIEGWGFKGDLEISGDPALALEPSSDIEATDTIVVAPAWTNGELWGGSDDDVYRHLSDAINVWRNQGRQVVLMSCHPTDDRPILTIKERLGAVEVGYLAGYLGVQESLDLIASASVVIGERLHACVLAAAADRPFVAVEYRPKLADFAESVSMGDFIIRSDDLESGGLLERAAVAEKHPRHEMSAAVTDYRNRLHRASVTIEAATRG